MKDLPKQLQGQINLLCNIIDTTIKLHNSIHPEAEVDWESKVKQAHAKTIIVVVIVSGAIALIMFNILTPSLKSFSIGKW